VLLLRVSLWQRLVDLWPARALVAGIVAVVVAAGSAVLNPTLAGPEGRSGSAASGSGMPAMSSAKPTGMMDMGSTAPPSAAQIAAAGQLIEQTTTDTARYKDVNAAIAAGYQPAPRPGTKPSGEYELHYVKPSNVRPGLDPRYPVGLVYAMNVPLNPPILLGTLFVEPPGISGPQVGGSLTRWHVHTAQRPPLQHMHVWTAPDYPGGPFSDNDTLSGPALQTVVNTVLASSR
jgi:hypothetical protein